MSNVFRTVVSKFIHDNYVSGQPYAKRLGEEGCTILTGQLVDCLIARYEGSLAEEAARERINLLFNQNGMLSPHQANPAWHGNENKPLIDNWLTNDFITYWNQQIADGNFAALQTQIKREEEKAAADEKAR